MARLTDKERQEKIKWAYIMWTRPGMQAWAAMREENERLLRECRQRQLANVRTFIAAHPDTMTELAEIERRYLIDASSRKTQGR
jgi:hypothetical protein